MTAKRLTSISSRLFRTSARWRSKALAVSCLLLFSVAGSVLLLRSMAAVPPVSAEPEAGALSGAVAACNDTASSGGRYVRFGAPACRTYANPVVNANCPDPTVYQEGATYYALCTKGEVPAFNIRTSTNLVNWTDTGKYVMPNRAPWALSQHYWAPDLRKIGSTYVVYFTSHDVARNFLCIGTATATNIMGPYTPASQPLVCPGGKAVLDSAYFKDTDGKQYLYWKEDLVAGNASGYLFVQQLDASGLRFAAGTTKRQLFKNDLAWENPLVEGPWVFKRDGVYYMIYSGAVFNNASYATGVAKASSPFGPWTKKGPPILKTGTRWKGPGHGGLAQAGGVDYYVYHAWEGSNWIDVRKMMVEKINWVNGWPEINNGTPAEGQLPYPL
ncbi:MAG TPA: glycoside hydrolase family 43 protein [Candidatus Saccharimonadales bacterium]|nr:glycoside hydrolase family 43 protein [Candidatus Saccharimonadales bacterium]